MLPVLFDYSDVDPIQRTMTIKPLSQQAQIFNQQLQRVRQEHPGVPVSVVAHSQGCVVVALAQPAGLKQAILLAPAEYLDPKRLKRAFSDRLHAETLADGTVKLARRDGSAVLIAAGYQSELASADPAEQYSDLATRTPVTIVRAAQDDIIATRLGPSLLNAAITIISLDGDHNFTGAARDGLVQSVKKLIQTT